MPVMGPRLGVPCGPAAMPLRPAGIGVDKQVVPIDFVKKST